MKVRKYHSEDNPQVVHLWETVFDDTGVHNQPNYMLDQKLGVDDLIFVAEENKQIIGACIGGYDGHRGWLYAIAVSPAQRSNGIGSALVDFALSSLHTLGCPKVNLQIRGSNPDVVAFYQKLGFQVEDRISMGLNFDERNVSKPSK